MKLNDSLSLESEVSDLLINKDFLKFFRKFLLKQGVDINYLEDNTNIFLEQFLDEDFDFSKLELSKKEILNAMGNIFSIPVVLNSFLEYLSRFNKNLDPKDSTLLIEISDYLVGVYNNSNRYNDIGLVEKQLKTKIENIIPREVNDTRLKLFNSGFSQFTQDELPIVWADFKDFLDTEKGKNLESGVYLKVKDYSGREVYINREGYILKDYYGKNVTQIEYNFYFGDILIAKYKNEDFETILDITDSNVSEYVENGYTDARLGDLQLGEEILEYLYLSKEEKGEIISGIYDKDIKRINVLNILKFLNPDQDEVLGLTLKILEDIKVSKIGKLHEFNGHNFIELEIETKYFDDYYGEERPFFQDVVLAWNGKILFDKISDYEGNVYIKGLEDEYNYLGKDFAGFNLTGFGIDGHIDASGEIVKIKGENLISLEKYHLSTSQDNYYILNGNKQNLLKEKEIILELSKYKSFDSKYLNIYLAESECFEYKESKITHISGEISNDGNLEISLINKQNSKFEITYNDLIDLLKNSDKKNVLKFFNETLKKIESV